MSTEREESGESGRTSCLSHGPVAAREEAVPFVNVDSKICLTDLAHLFKRSDRHVLCVQIATMPRLAASPATRIQHGHGASDGRVMDVSGALVHDAHEIYFPLAVGLAITHIQLDALHPRGTSLA